MVNGVIRYLIHQWILILTSIFSNLCIKKLCTSGTHCPGKTPYWSTIMLAHTFFYKHRIFFWLRMWLCGNNPPIHRTSIFWAVGYFLTYKEILFTYMNNLDDFLHSALNSIPKSAFQEEYNRLKLDLLTTLKLIVKFHSCFCV